MRPKNIFKTVQRTVRITGEAETALADMRGIVSKSQGRNVSYGEIISFAILKWRKELK